jgi:hypothetical protein
MESYLLRRDRFITARAAYSTGLENSSRSRLRRDLPLFSPPKSDTFQVDASTP